MTRIKIGDLILISSICSSSLFGLTADDLYTDLQNLEASITFDQDINLKDLTINPFLFPVNSNTAFVPQVHTTTIIGKDHTLNGKGSNRGGFFIRGGTVNINNLIFERNTAKGGNSGNGKGGLGGGGAALGGSLFIGAGSTVTLTDVSFVSSSAIGGSSGFIQTSGFASGGGGLIGKGGINTGGGGSFFDGGNGSDRGGGGSGVGFPGGDPTPPNMGGKGGNNFANVNGGAGGIGLPGANGLAGGGGGGGGEGSAGGVGGIGGGGGGAGGFEGGLGGNADFGGGGGGAGVGLVGGNGGFGGGGGGAGSGGGGSFGGNAGFGGGGGGGGVVGTFGNGGFGGGDGGESSGGGGGALGGAIFIDEAATLTIEQNGPKLFSNSFITGGTRGTDAQDGLAFGRDIFIVSGSQLNFKLNTPVTLNFPIEGNLGVGRGAAGGGLEKTGPYLLVLNGANTYTGMTTVKEGELKINGSVASDIKVDGGTLSGVFATVANTFNDGNLTLTSGRFAPGNAGEVNLAGTFTHDGGTFAVDATPDPFAVHLVSAALATINGGDLEVTLGNGNYIAGTVLTVIDAPTNGTVYPDANIIPVGALADVVDIEVAFGSLTITILTTSIFHDQNITSPIAQEVAKSILCDLLIDPTSDLAFVFQLLGLLPDANNALESLAPTQYGQLDWINARQNSQVTDIISQRLFELCCSARDCCDPCANTSGWISFYGNVMDNRKRFDNLKPFNADNYGVIAGIDTCCFSDLFVGAAAGYTYSSFDASNKFLDGDSNTYYGSLYGGYDAGCFAVDLSVLGGGTDYSMARKIEFPNLSRKAKSDPWGYFATVHLGALGRYEACFTFSPYALMDYHYYYRESFKETKAESINLNVKSYDQHLIRGEAGVRAYYTFVCSCFCWAPYIGGSWVGEFPLSTSHQEASFVGQSCVMKVKAYDSDVHLGSPEVGFNVAHECGLSIIGSYKGLFNDKTRLNQFDIRLDYVF